MSPHANVGDHWGVRMTSINPISVSAKPAGVDQQKFDAMGAAIVKAAIATAPKSAAPITTVPVAVKHHTDVKEHTASSPAPLNKIDPKEFVQFGDKNGSLANWELRGAILERGLHLHQPTVDVLLDWFDANKDGVVDANEVDKMFAVRALIFSRSGKAVLNGLSSVQAASAPGATIPFAAANYSDYINKETIPGKEANISQLAFLKILDEYKDAPKGSDGRKMYDLLLAAQFLKDGYKDNYLFESDLSGHEVGKYVLDGEAVDSQFKALMTDATFKEEYEQKFREKLDQTIKENFIIFNDKITLFDPNNIKHTNVYRVQSRRIPRSGLITRLVPHPANHPRVDLAMFSDAMKASVNNPANIDAYGKKTADQQQDFIRDKFGSLATLLTPEDFATELASFGAGVGIKAVLGTPLNDVSDEALSTGAQLAGQWIAKLRGPLNLIGTVSNLRPEQWKVVAQTFKAMLGGGQNPADFAAFMKALPESQRTSMLGNTMKQLAQNGLFGSMAASAAVIGSSIAYSTTGPARDRLLAGDPREVMTLVNNIAMPLSYAPSLVKGPPALLSAFGVKDAEDFLAKFKDLPDAGRMFGSYLTRFQPTFTQLEEALKGVDLTNEEAVKSALEMMDPTKSRKLLNDFGYDFNTLAKRISTNAQKYSPDVSGLDAPDRTQSRAAEELENSLGVRTFENVKSGNNFKAFVLDALDVDKDLRILTKANNLLQNNQLTTPDYAGIRELLGRKGMTDEQITKVMSYGAVDPADLAGTSVIQPGDTAGPSTSAAGPTVEIELAERVRARVPPPPVDSVTELGNALSAQLDAKLSNSRVAAPFKSKGIAKFGIGIKGLAAGVDVLGGIAGVGIGIFDIIKGKDDDDILRIVSGTLGIGSGVAGSFGGLAGLGLIASSAATPLFVVAGVLGLVSLFVGLFSGDQRTQVERFADGLLDRFRDYNIIRARADRYLESWYLNNLHDRFIGSGGMS